MIAIAPVGRCWLPGRMERAAARHPIDRDAPCFSLAELVRSTTAQRLGMPNTPGPDALVALKGTARLLQAIRDALGPVRVTSGYRSPRVNAAIPGASRSSAHVWGNAADIEVAGWPNWQVATWLWLERHRLPLDQVIWYEDTRHTHIGLWLGPRAKRIRRGQFRRHTSTAVLDPRAKRLTQYPFWRPTKAQVETVLGHRRKVPHWQPEPPTIAAPRVWPRTMMT